MEVWRNVTLIVLFVLEHNWSRVKVKMIPAGCVNKKKKLNTCINIYNRFNEVFCENIPVGEAQHSGDALSESVTLIVVLY